MGDNISTEPSPGSKNKTADTPTATEDETTITHQETTSSQKWIKWNWGSGKSREGDTAQALFDDPDELQEEIDPAAERKLLWKIDFMILPYLAVCYAFFYIDKVWSFGIRDVVEWALTIIDDA